MTDDIQHRINRGKRASILLGDELLIEAFDTLKREYIEAWMQTAALETTKRELLWLATNQVDKLRDRLAIVVGDGTMAQHELAQIEAEPKD